MATQTRITNIFLLDGLGGTGKSDFMRYVRKKFSATPQRGVVIGKITTRPRRPEEETNKAPLDLTFVTPKTFVEHKKRNDLYSYDFGGYVFGFHRREIEKAIAARVKHVFIIVKERAIQEQIVRDFRRCRVVRVFIYSDREEIRRRLIADGYTDEHIAFRLNRIADNWFDYTQQSQNYDEILINNSDRESFHKVIDSLVTKYEGYPPDELVIDHQFRYPLITSLVGYKEAMIQRLNRFSFDRNVFLMMKFRRGNKALHTHIETKLGSLGYNCVRADDSGWNITKNTYNPLAVLYCCRYGIAVFDEPEPANSFSPNVSYELGVMHYQRKNCLILKHESLPQLPFDLIKDLHTPYSDSGEATQIVDRWIDNLQHDEIRLT
jgi:guanylate kinase